MKHKNDTALNRHITNWNWKVLAYAIICSARKALGGEASDQYSKACGFKTGEQDALQFFTTDWAHNLVDLAFDFDGEPDELIERWLREAYGKDVYIKEHDDPQPVVRGPHIRKRIFRPTLEVATEGEACVRIQFGSL